jgi:parvulin-like peptidyl-prolyl isomerase
VLPPARAGVAFVLLGFVVACGRGGLPAGSVARVGDRDIDYARFAEYVEEVTGESGEALESAVLAGLFQQFLEEELLLELARERRLVGEHAGRRDAAAALFGRDELEASEEELESYYQSLGAELEAPERLRLRHLLFEDRDTAEEAEARLRAGESAGRLADELGALGLEEVEASREDLPIAFADTLFGLEPGGVAVVGDGFQFHVFAILARRPAGRPAFEEVMPDLRRRLAAERLRALRDELLDEARRRYNVEVAAARLPFALAPAGDAEAVSEEPPP